MTAEPRYIIKEKELGDIADLLKRNSFFQSVIDEYLNPVYNRPYNAKSTGKVLDEILDEMVDIDAWGEKGTGYLVVDDDVKAIIQRKKTELRQQERDR